MACGEEALVPVPLRERQQNAVRTSIMDAGIALFLERGFGDTTIEMIAQAAGVSRRTVFRHFTSKDEIVAAWSHMSSAALALQVQARPSAEPMISCLCSVLLDHVVNNAALLPAALVIGRLIQDTPSLRVRNADKYARWEAALAKALVERAEADPATAPLAPVAAAVAVSAFRVAAQEWIDSEGAIALPDALVDRFSALATLQRQSE